MCLATLSTKAGKLLHAVLLALPHPRGFISLTEQQQLATANQHAVSKGRLRWQLSARAMLSACCHPVIVFTTGGTASHLAGQHACQQTLCPPLILRHIHGGGVLSEDPHPNLCVMFFSLLTPPSPFFSHPLLSDSPLPQMLWKKVKTTTNKQHVSCCFWWWVLLLSLSSPPLPACILHKTWVMQANLLASWLSRCALLHRVTDSFWRICPACLFFYSKEKSLKAGSCVWSHHDCE